MKESSCYNSFKTTVQNLSASLLGVIWVTDNLKKQTNAVYTKKDIRFFNV